jgi:WD40 repeat protein
MDMKYKCIQSASEFYSSICWSPDESQLIYSSNQIGIHTVDTNTNNFINQTPYSYDWFPFMSNSDPTTCCFITCIKDHPVQLFDSNTRRLRFSYKTKNNADEISSPLTCKFNLFGDKIYCGMDSCIQIFDIHGELLDIFMTSKNRKSKNGLKGLVSSIHFNPDGSGIYALGSFSGQIGLYDERNNEEFYILRDTNSPIGTYQGITQVSFSDDGRYLVSASRNSNELHVWDIRQTGEILHRLPRAGETPQRIYFSIFGTHVWTGDTNGNVLEYEIETGQEISCINISTSTVSGCSKRSQLATCSGQREFCDSDEIPSLKESCVLIWDQ